MTGARDLEKTPYESVQQTEGDAPSVSQRACKRRSRWEKLGTFNIFVLILGTAAIFLSIAFLAFVWSVSIHQPLTGYQPQLWKDIVKNKWTTRVVTLATILIRTANAAQLAVFASILAALILERAGTSAVDFPKLSMIRCSNSGPQGLIWHVLHSISNVSQLGYSFVIVIAILNALALQFTSTLLLADFRDTLVILGNASDNFSWGSDLVSQDSLTVGNDFWKTASTSLPAFAEFADYDVGPGPNYLDTGKTYRGFLPFHNATLRQALRSCNGPMTVVDERVICVRPNMSEVTFSNRLLYEDMAWIDNTISGIINLNGSHPDIVTAGSGLQFNCSLPGPNRGTSWPLALCQLLSQNATLKGGITDLVPKIGEGASAFDYPSMVTALFLNLSAPLDFQYTNWQEAVLEGSFLTLPKVDSDEVAWSKYGYSNASIALSLCLMNPTTGVYDVSASTSTSTAEEKDTLFWDPQTKTYETAIALTQLGITYRYQQHAGEEFTFPEKRGLLNLYEPRNWTADRLDTKQNQGQTWLRNTLIKVSTTTENPDTNSTTGNTLYLSNGSGTDSETVHKSLQALAQGGLGKGEVARTLQSLVHVIMQTAYYEYFPSLSLKDPGLYTETSSRSIPNEWKHFKVVMALLGVHLVLVFGAVIVFLSMTEMSLLGNAWQAVAQVHSNDTAHAFQEGHMTTDKELEESAKTSGVDGRPILIKRSELNGRQEAVIVNHRT